MTLPLPISDQLFTPADIEAIARVHGCTPKALKHRWIIQSGKAFYVLGPDGEYHRPITRGELPQSLGRDLRRVPEESKEHPYGIRWIKTKNDADVPRSVDELLADHCTVARGVVADMSIPRSHYDEVDQTFYEAVCPLSRFEPIFHPDVDQWLRLFGGPQYDKLNAWMATATRTDRPSCALLITGKSGAGKEMLAQGLARLWRRAKAPTELGRVLEGFNEDLARCPLVFCDENMPATRGGRRSALADLRSMIAASSRTLARKFLSNADLVGAVRLILAANNNNLVASNEDMTLDDQEATAIRFLHINVTDAPVKYLRSIGGREATESWVKGGKIAEHATWLAQNITVTPGNRRFLVEGDASNVQRQLIVNNKHTSTILEWLVKFVASGPKPTPQAVVGNGKVLINTTAISQHWTSVVHNEFVPSVTRIGTSLRTLSTNEQRLYWIEADGKVREVRYQAVDPEFLYEWSRQNQISDPDTLRTNINTLIDLRRLTREEERPPPIPLHS